jgi:hypothetical protein
MQVTAGSNKPIEHTISWHACVSAVRHANIDPPVATCSVAIKHGSTNSAKP